MKTIFIVLGCLLSVACSSPEERFQERYYSHARVTSCICAHDDTIRRIDLQVEGEVIALNVINDSPTCGTFKRGLWNFKFSVSPDGTRAKYISVMESH